MRMLTKFSAGFACLGLVFVAGDAVAKSRSHAAGRRPLVIERRSFLDSGTVAPVGSTNRYMLQQTFYHRDPVFSHQRSWHGGETLPRRGDQPWSPGFPIDLF